MRCPRGVDPGGRPRAPPPTVVPPMDMDPRLRRATLLPPRAQPVVAAAVAAGLVAAAAWFAAVGGLRGGLVHHDAAPAVGHSFTVDVNLAAEDELAQLPGLGATMARRIVDHRRGHGPFTTVDGLLDVPGIGPATLARMRPHLRPVLQPAAAAGVPAD